MLFCLRDIKLSLTKISIYLFQLYPIFFSFCVFILMKVITEVNAQISKAPSLEDPR